MLIRIDVDHFKYGGILRKVERVGMGEEVDADDEEEGQEVLKEKRQAINTRTVSVEWPG